MGAADQQGSQREKGEKMSKVQFFEFVSLNESDKKRQVEINNELKAHGFSEIFLTKTNTGKYGFRVKGNTTLDQHAFIWGVVDRRTNDLQRRRKKS